MENGFSKIWHDPVWSKVISGAILAAIASIFGFITIWLPWFQERIAISRYVLGIGVVLLVPANLWWIGRLAKALRVKQGASLLIAESEFISEEPDATDASFRLEEIEVRMLVHLYKAPERHSAQQIARVLKIEHIQTAKYHLRRIRLEGFVDYWSPPVRLTYHGSSGYALLQKGRAYVIENDLLTTEGRYRNEKLGRA